MKDAVGFAFNLPEIPGLGSTAGVEVNLQNRSGQGRPRFREHVQAFVPTANQLPAVQAMTTNFRANVPQVYLDVDRDTAKSRGVSLTDLFSTLQTLLSTLYINDFNLYGRTYRVQAEAQPQFRQTPGGHRTAVRPRPQRGDDPGLLAGADRVPERAHPAAPVQRLRLGAFHRHAQAGSQLGRADRSEIDQLADRAVRAAGRGLSRTPGSRSRSGLPRGQAGLVFALGLVIVFLVLAAQYESWSIPFAVLFGVPFGALGALLGVWIRGCRATSTSRSD